jgi:hypothetical protein
MKYKKHEYGIESECGQYVLENLEECMEELNALIKARDEARRQAEEFRDNMRESYNEMWRKVQAGEISEDEWRKFCDRLLEQTLEDNKDVMVRLKNRY